MKKNIIIFLIVIIFILLFSDNDIIVYIENTYNLSELNLNDTELEEYINKQCIITDDEEIYKTICNAFCNTLSLTARKEFYKRGWKIITTDKPLFSDDKNITVGCTSLRYKVIVIYSKNDKLKETVKHELLHYCIYLYQYKINYLITKDLNNIYKEEKNNLILDTDYDTNYAKSNVYEYYCNIYGCNSINNTNTPKSQLMINKILSKVNHFAIIK